MADSDKIRIDALERRRQKYMLRLTALHEIGVKCNEAVSQNQEPLQNDVDSFKCRYKFLENDFKIFDELTDEIGDLNVNLPSHKQTNVIGPYTKYEDMYFAVQSIANHLPLDDLSQSTDAQTNEATFGSVETSVSQCRLPKIAIEPFDGNIEKWPNFHALYTTLIHNNKTYSKIEKFTHLRSLLRSHALSLVENLPITHNNYLIAYDTLTNRFQNVRLLGAHYVDKVLAFRTMTNSSHATLIQFIEVFSTNINALKMLGIDNLFDFFILQIALRALPEKVRVEFENKNSSTATPKFEDLVQFIHGQIRILELAPETTKIAEKSNRSKFTEKPTKGYSSKTTLMTMADSKRDSTKCPKCSGSHKLYGCPDFKKLSVSDRHSFVKVNNLCFSCMGVHRRSQCRSKSVCGECKASSHHTLLHFQSHPPVNTQGVSSMGGKPQTYVAEQGSSRLNVEAQTVPFPGTQASLACSANPTHLRKRVLLSTAIIQITDKHGIPRSVKAVLDTGSQVSLISESCVQKLGLPRRHGTLAIVGVASTPSLPIRGVITCTVTSSRSPKHTLTAEAHILPQISTAQPNFQVDESVYRKFKHLSLADPTFHQRSAVEFLMGADLFASVLTEPCSFIKGEPAALNTIFGWVIGGPVPPTQAPCTDASIALLACCEQLDHSIRKFWETEEITALPPEDPEDQFCEKHFLDTYSRDESGRYMVRLPFSTDKIILPSTRNHAYRCLLSLERRLKRQPEVFREYRNYMDEFIELGHITPAVKPSRYVIPHHCVLKADSSTTKVRTVFNASFRPDSTSLSLNEVLLRGPKLQKEISNILNIFRLGSAVVCCDLRQMYRQVMVHPDERQYQHLFYRPQLEGGIVEYQLNTLVFGVKPSAFLAQRVLVQLVRDEGERYPLASEATLHQTFVDNVCQSVNSVQTAKTLQRQLIELFGLGGFSLRKWASNRQEILDMVPAEHREHTLVVRDNDEDHCVKILGLQYEPSDDSFSYVISPKDPIFTKRGSSSQIAQIYDPLGWLTPVVFMAKCLMQRTWQRGIGWDEPLPPDIGCRWRSLLDELPLLSQVRIPRHMPIDFPGSATQLIGFCDASEQGYAAAIYLRVEARSHISMHLVTAKSKLAPLKTLSIPRLELSGAVLLTRLLSSVSALREHVRVSSVHLFTDSSTVLSWIRTPPHRLKTFVANRVVNILELSHPDQWGHVPTRENPADSASRGITPREFLALTSWWAGPSFTHDSLQLWPTTQITLDDEKISAEHKRSPENVLLTSTPNKSIFLELMERVSNLASLQRIAAHVLRAVRHFKARPPDKTDTGPITPLEMRDALNACVKATQQFYYAQEIEKLKGGSKMSTALMKLTPFLDCLGFMRVGGRLRHSSLSYSAKHPLLLPRKSRLAEMICDHLHRITLHSGPRLIQSLIQRQFWIVSIRQLLRQRLHKCLPCTKLRAKPLEPLMADLPAVRIRECRPILNTGIDFAGPLTIKESSRRKSPRSKGYLVIFVCMSTKATHLEFASSLSTPCFLAALDRFVARRGLCAQIFSDCGTNFKGASNHFCVVRRFLRSNEISISEYLSARSIKWNFNAPAAPHQGGLWESGIKSAKHHLVRIIGTLVLTFEEMTTLLTRIEAVLNSRPLGALSCDPNDETDYLSPGHFLVGTPLLSPPEVIIDEPIMKLRDRYEILQKAAQCFWKRWSKDYLHTLIPRKKWAEVQRNVHIGDVVYVKTPNTPPLQWPIGRVVEVYPGQDAVVRNVKVKTYGGTYVRPVQKLVALPFLTDSATPSP